jgi:hypothetical protein
LRITNVRLEAPPAEAPKPSAVLRFDVLNDSDSKVTDIVFEIAMHEKPAEHARAAPRLVVSPFVIQGNVTLEAGYTVSYELLLRNLLPDCGCVPNVVVTSARALSELP